ncbi:MAG: hypothetical protein QOE58_557 [Actinomycetota bacterium]|nr:hypothetical protein [Actinomycetota bacterium]
MPRSCAWPPRRAPWYRRACAGGTGSAPVSATASPATRRAPPLPWRLRCSTSPPTAGNRAAWRPRRRSRRQRPGAGDGNADIDTAGDLDDLDRTGVDHRDPGGGHRVISARMLAGPARSQLRRKASTTIRPRPCVVSVRAGNHWCASWARPERATRSLAATRAAWAASGVRVRGLAASATATSVLGTEAGVPADTVAKFLWGTLAPTRARNGGWATAR